ncbi:hypothetical protein SGLAM104S_10650 [Streptomyces glaucescens]
MERFPHAPREAVFKEDLLRGGGIAFDPSALSDNEDGEVKPKSYFIFSFDHGTLPELGEAALRRPPEEIILTGGPYDLRLHRRLRAGDTPPPPTGSPPNDDGRPRPLPRRAAHRRTSASRRCPSTTGTPSPTGSPSWRSPRPSSGAT